jgi:hypothetical protein
MKKLLLVVSLVTIFVSGAIGAEFAVNSRDLKAIDAPHDYEFDSHENPKKYYWCGHTALKIALEANSVYKKLKEIHNDFYDIDHNENRWMQYTYDNCRGHWCAFPKLVEYSINRYRVEEGINIYYNRYSYSDKNKAFEFIKRQINQKHLVIIFSDKFYSYKNKKWYKTGHFFVVNGYNTKGRNKWLYVRDPDNNDPDYWFADKAFKFDDIWKYAKHDNRLVLLVISQ